MSTPPKQFYIARAGYSRTQKLLNGALLFEVPESLRLVSELGAPAFEVDGLGTGNPLKVVFGRLPRGTAEPLAAALAQTVVVVPVAVQPLLGTTSRHNKTPSGVRRRKGYILREVERLKFNGLR